MRSIHLNVIFLFAIVFGFSTLTKGADTTLVNGGFEKLDHTSMPLVWYKYIWTGTPVFSVDSTVNHSGKYSAKISGTNIEGCWGQDIALKPNHYYRITGWIRTENFRGGRGVCIIIGFNNISVGKIELHGTNNWTQVKGEFFFPEGTSDWPPTIRCYAGGTGTAWFDDISLQDLGTSSWSYVYFDTPHFNVKLLSTYESYKPFIEKYLEMGYKKYVYYTGIDLDSLTSKIQGNSWVHHPKCYFMFLRSDDMWWPGWGGGLTIANQCQVNAQLLPGIKPGTNGQCISWHELANAWHMVWGTRGGKSLGTPWWFANEGHAGFLEHHATCDLGTLGRNAKIGDYNRALDSYHRFMNGDATVEIGYVTVVFVESIWAKYGWSLLRKAYDALQSGEITFPTTNDTTIVNSTILVKFLSEKAGENIAPFCREKFKIKIDPSVAQELSALPTADIPIVQNITESIPVIRSVKTLENTYNTTKPYNITAEVTSSPSPLTEVRLWFSCDHSFQSVEMRDDGNHDDGAAGDGIFGASISPCQYETTVKYYITAENSFFERTANPYDAPDGFYRFVVWSDTSTVANFQFETPKADSIIDSTPFGNNGIILGGGAYSNQARFGRYAIYLNGDSAFAEVPNGPSLNLRKFTVEMWIKPDSIVSNCCLIMKKMVPQSPTAEYEIKFTDSGNIMGGRFFTPLHSIQTDSTLSPGNWYHVAYSFDGDSAYLYLADSTNHIIQKVVKSDTAAIPAKLFKKYQGPLYIGHSGYKSNPYFSGLIDNIKICNYAKSESKILTDVRDVQDNLRQYAPVTFKLFQNYPNPFNSCTTISFNAPRNSLISLKVYNSLGQKVKTIIGWKKMSGLQTVVWDGKNDIGLSVPSGVYFCKISDGKEFAIKKLVLLK